MVVGCSSAIAAAAAATVTTAAATAARVRPGLQLAGMEEDLVPPACIASAVRAI